MHTKITALDSMQRSTRVFLELLDGISDEQWRLRPSDQEWSLAETVEHVVLANRGTLARLRQLLEAPIATHSTRFDDAAISGEMFQNAGPAPGLAEPTGRFATRAEGVAALVATRDGIAAWAQATEHDLRAHGLPHPVFGLFDGVQWILFSAAHTDNHVPQLRALRAHPELATAS